MGTLRFFWHTYCAGRTRQKLLVTGLGVFAKTSTPPTQTGFVINGIKSGNVNLNLLGRYCLALKRVLINNFTGAVI